MSHSTTGKAPRQPCAIPELTPPEPYASAIGFARELDRAYFEANPSANKYTRNIVQGEQWPYVVELASAKRVLVVQLKPGLRIKTFLE
jgi:hypothetical protein